MNTLACKNIIEGNWDEIKGDIQNKWEKLTESDLDKIDGSYKKFVAQLKKLYGYDMSELEEEISEFFQSSRFEKMKRAALRKIHEVKDIAASVLDDSLEVIKQKKSGAEEAIIEYAKENPFKVAGLAVAAGFLLSSLLYKR